MLWKPPFLRSSWEGLQVMYWSIHQYISPLIHAIFKRNYLKFIHFHIQRKRRWVRRESGRWLGVVASHIILHQESSVGRKLIYIINSVNIKTSWNQIAILIFLLRIRLPVQIVTWSSLMNQILMIMLKTTTMLSTLRQTSVEITMTLSCCLHIIRCIILLNPQIWYSFHL